MKLPDEILQILRCSHCKNFLSRGPVYIEHDGSAACSACRSKKRPSIRNTYYEAIAKLTSFPCKYQELGCNEYVPFTGEGENKHHKEICEHREFVCPLLGSSRCEWLGNKNAILDHCQSQHADKVVSNNFTLSHDITKSSTNTYLLNAFQFLFLLYTKVCTTSGKLYHSVRYMGRSDEVDNFSFNLKIQRKDEVFVKKGTVAPQGCLAIQEPTSLTLDLNSLLSMLCGWDDASFTITINQIIKKANICKICGLKQPTVESDEEIKWTCDRCDANNEASTLVIEPHIKDINTCVKCGVITSEIMYHDNDGGRCCSPTKTICNNEYCMFKDIDVKCRKHKSYFCKMRTSCYLCRNDLSGISLDSHYAICNPYMCKQQWTINFTNDNRFKSENIIFESIAGLTICFYNITYTHFILEVYTSVATDQLHNFQCVIELTTGKKKHLVFKPDIEYNNVYDWIVK